MILIVKHSPNQNMVRLLIVCYEYFIYLLLVDIPSTDNVDKDNYPTSVTDGETQTHHSTSREGIQILLHNEVLDIYIFYITSS